MGAMTLADKIVVMNPGRIGHVVAPLDFIFARLIALSPFYRQSQDEPSGCRHGKHRT
jgi:hypothetical protein